MFCICIVSTAKCTPCMLFRSMSSTSYTARMHDKKSRHPVSTHFPLPNSRIVHVGSCNLTVIAANFFFTKHEFGSSMFTSRKSSGPGVTAIRAVPTTLCTSAHCRVSLSLSSLASLCASK